MSCCPPVLKGCKHVFRRSIRSLEESVDDFRHLGLAILQVLDPLDLSPIEGGRLQLGDHLVEVGHVTRADLVELLLAAYEFLN